MFLLRHDFFFSSRSTDDVMNLCTQYTANQHWWRKRGQLTRPANPTGPSWTPQSSLNGGLGKHAWKGQHLHRMYKMIWATLLIIFPWLLPHQKLRGGDAKPGGVPHSQTHGPLCTQCWRMSFFTIWGHVSPHQRWPMFSQTSLSAGQSLSCVTASALLQGLEKSTRKKLFLNWMSSPKDSTVPPWGQNTHCE